MRTLRSVLLLILGAALAPLSGAASELPHHDLQVQISPAENRLSATDTVTLPSDAAAQVTFRLHAGLEVHAVTSEVVLEQIALGETTAVYRVRLPPGRRSFTLRYRGQLFDALSAPEAGYARGIARTAGQISDAGVYLTGASRWYPQLEQELLTFTLEVTLPDGWTSVSQGRRSREAGTETWASATPQQQIYLVAGRFSTYTRATGEVTAMAFLRAPEPELAKRYLLATEQYLAMYDALIGPYPYAKFAVIENFWETGYGMPSFTLLGPRVIRFPFILTSSYPHEILHNWWGNAVYPDYARGNWAEGLTAYLSDHLLKVQDGAGAAYRKAALQKYADYVTTAKDFPLTDFTARHSSATEAVGYGKGMLLFHMLRRELGDATFTTALQSFYHRHRFTRAGFAELQAAFEEAAGRSLDGSFAQWVERPGAPELVIEDVALQPQDGNYRLRATLRQVQGGPPYALRIPLAVTLAGADRAREIEIAMDARQQAVELDFAAEPLRLDVDPRYDLFRKLDRAEAPPALSRIFGAAEAVFVLPEAAPDTVRAAYRELAEKLGRAGPEQVHIVLDRELEVLPDAAAVVLLGWENRFRDRMAEALEAYGSKVTEAGATLDGEEFPRHGLAAVVAVRHPHSAAQTLAWVGADEVRALPGLARKLPHYHKYSYLAFRGAEPENVAKGRWPVLNSPLTVFFGDVRPPLGALPKRAPLIALPNVEE